MRSGTPESSRKRRASPVAPEGRLIESLLRALEAHADGALARAVFELAAEPPGSGLDALHFYETDTRGSELRGWSASPGVAPRKRAATDAGDDALRPPTLLPERLEGPALEAWRKGLVVMGAPEGPGMPWSRARCVGAFALEIGGRRLGLVVGEWQGAMPSAAKREAFERLALQATSVAHAVSRTSLERRRERHAAAIAEFARASVSALNVAEAFHLGARLVTEATGSRGSALWRATPAGSPLLEVTFGVAGQRERLARGLQHVAAAVLGSGEPRVLERVTDEALLSPETAAQLDSLAVLPVRAYGHCVGVLAVYDRVPRGALEPAGYDEFEMGALAVLADQLALVMDQAQRFEELQRSELRGRELQARVAREERLASLGEMAVRVAEDARNPLASIGAFARRVHRELPENSPHREYLEIVIREAERLERIVGSPLESMPGEPLRLRIESLNELVQDVLRAAGETLVRRRIRLLKKLSPDLPPLLLDVDRMRAAIANVLRQAMEGVPVGGRIRVESRRSAGFAVLEVAHDGPREPGDLVEQLFIPFGSSRGGGPALGLNVAQQVIQGHGGEIRARREAEWTAVVSLTLPIQGNEDRRRSRGERRASNHDRRRRGPERDGRGLPTAPDR
jgi:nitrogen-specific signal transduction histidine kinase